MSEEKDMPQDVKPEAVFLAILETQKRAWMFNSGLQPTNEFYKGGFVSLEIAIEALSERIDANSKPSV